MQRPNPIRLAFLFLLPIAFLFLGTACDAPCEALYAKVCEDPAYAQPNSKDCKLMSDKARREALPKAYCESILKSLDKKP